MKSGGLVLWNAIAICETSKTSWQSGKLRMKDDFENHSKGQQFLFGAMVEYHPISAKDLSRIHQFGKKVSPGIFLGCELIAGRIWKGEILNADLEDLEKLDASEILSSKNQPERSIDQMVQQNCQEETTNSENPL